MIRNADGHSGDEIDETTTSSSQPTIEMEVLIGALTAVTLLLMFMFVSIVFIYSRRQKFLNSPTSRSMNPFPVQINMKVSHANESLKGYIYKGVHQITSNSIQRIFIMIFLCDSCIY